MSTYLVAFVIGEFDYVEERSADGVLCRVYTPVGKKEQGRFGLYVTTKVLPYYKEYFGVEYPLPKMDNSYVKHLHNFFFFDLSRSNGELGVGDVP